MASATEPHAGPVRLSDEQRRALRDFWEVYDANYDSVWGALRRKYEEGGADGAAIEEQARTTRPLRTAAVCEGNWQPFVDYLKSLGVLYAENDIPFTRWFEFVGVFRAELGPRLYTAYGGDPARYQRSVAGMNLFVDLSMAAIGEAYVERKQAIIYRQRADLEESERRFRDLFENANDAVYTLTREGVVTSMNRAAEEITGFTRAEALGRNVAEWIAPEHLERSLNMLGRKLAGDERTRYELDVVRKDGRRITLEVSSRLITRDGQPAGIQGVARDITARKEAEAAIRALSTPVLQVSDHLLIVPLIGAVDSARARQLTVQLLAAIRERRARAVVVDITGVVAVDADVANHILQTIAACRLLGAEVVITGVSRQIAQTLVESGVDLRGLSVMGDLRSGIEACQALLRTPAPGKGVPLAPPSRMAKSGRTRTRTVAR